MSTSALYRRHLETLDRNLSDALARAARKGLKLDGVLFHAGRASVYHRDDQEVAFHPTPHFVRYVPLEGPEHCVLARPGKRPLVVRVAPKDFWYEVVPTAPSFWQGEVDFAEVESLPDVLKVTGNLSNCAYVGNSAEAAGELKIAPNLIEPEALLAPLDWHRAVKTEHEVALLDAAARRGADGHRAAKAAFDAGLSELEIHWAYLRATGSLEREMPFETIVAIDEKSATLHYPLKRTEIRSARHTFLCDAGAAWDGYASDITRTWLGPKADPVFAALLQGLDSFQRDLVAMVTAGRSYPDIHFEAHRRTAALLVKTQIARCSAEEALEKGVTRTFLPHGVGHHLGIQVHDIGGRQESPDGGTRPPPPEHRYLRNTRVLEPGHVVTIEPGIYFTPVLLEGLQSSPAASLVDWRLIGRLRPLGGMRIEDDILCTESGPRDLTRPLIPGPRGS